IDCAPGQKRARVSFAVDRNFAEFTQLFTATSLMPSHVIADELGLGEGGVTNAIQAYDIPQIDRIAGLWNTLWDLKPGIDLKHFPSSGPYRIDAVREDGSVVLVTNEKWWGPAAETPRVTVWPHGIEVQDRINDAT
ncbi:hypothetical protein H7H98_12415, partial [Mycolicibacterium sphagni]|nr:hypothetical protein [Mycolicibacterium sphagni]